ncbi:MAG: helix-turn-helix domain-containing protein [Salibacteraceae bacterium]
MQSDPQKTIFEIIKRQTQGESSIGNVVGEILSISQDAVYRRFRGETHLTILELKKLCTHFNISLDTLFEIHKNKALIEFQPLNEYDFSMDLYLKSINKALTEITKQKNPKLTILINNTPILQLLNYPHLVRFKLFFWAKTYLQLEEFNDKKFKYEKISPESFNIGYEALKMYDAIPSREIYDLELLGGFAREIFYYYEAEQFEDPDYAVYMLDLLNRFVDHLQAQAEAGKKFVSTLEAPSLGNDFEMYLNETLNGNTTILYHTEAFEGAYIGHNLLNSVHTTDKAYIQDTKSILDKQISNSSLISGVNEKQRNGFFAQIKRRIDAYKKKIQTDLEIL